MIPSDLTLLAAVCMSLLIYMPACCVRVCLFISLSGSESAASHDDAVPYVALGTYYCCCCLIMIFVSFVYLFIAHHTHHHHHHHRVVVVVVAVVNKK